MRRSLYEQNDDSVAFNRVKCVYDIRVVWAFEGYEGSADNAGCASQLGRGVSGILSSGACQPDRVSFLYAIAVEDTAGDNHDKRICGVFNSLYEGAGEIRLSLGGVVRGRSRLFYVPRPVAIRLISDCSSVWAMFLPINIQSAGTTVKRLRIKRQKAA